MINDLRKFWRNKKVFVTGHTGFKGSWLCIFLNLLGCKVTGYSLNPKSSPSLFGLSNVKNLINKSIIADVRNYKKLYKSIKDSKAEIIFHLAAQPLVRDSYLNPKETFDININGTLNIIECIRNIPAIKSSVIITTDKVYDITKNRIFKEDDLLGGKDPYSASKVCCEYIFTSYLKSFFEINKNQKISTVRAGNVIGGGDYSKDRLIPDIYKSIQRRKEIILRNPNSVRPWQHVLEPLSGYLLLTEQLYSNTDEFTSGWNFGPIDDDVKPVTTIVEYLINKWNHKQGYTNDNSTQPFESQILKLDISKARNLLGWKPKWNLFKALDSIVEWHKAHLNSEDMRYLTLKQIQEFEEK